MEDALDGGMFGSGGALGGLGVGGLGALGLVGAAFMAPDIMGKIFGRQ